MNKANTVNYVINLNYRLETLEHITYICSMGNYKNKEEFEQRLNILKKLLLENYSVTKACEIAKISQWSAYKILGKNDYKQKNCQYRYNHEFFDNIDCEEKAYLLGFFVADGTIEKTNNRFAIHNSIDDLEIGYLFKRFICPDKKITLEFNEDKKDAFAFRWSSNHMKNKMKEYNIHPNKTYDFDFTFDFKILGNLTRHFIRGFFDGDGSISGNTFQFISTSLPFIKQLNEIMTSRFIIEERIREKKTKNVIEYVVYYTAFNKRKQFLSELYDWLYNDSQYYLVRKKVKFEEYLNTVLNDENKSSSSV